MVLQFLTFELDWLFVAQTQLHGYRRSLLTILLNIPEMALYFAILLELTGCITPASSLWPVVKNTFLKTFGFKLILFEELTRCQVIAFTHFTVTKLLVGAIIVGLIQQVRRSDTQ